MGNKKGAIMSDTTLYIVIMIAIIAIIGISYGLISGKLAGWVEVIRNWLRFGV